MDQYMIGIQHIKRLAEKIEERTGELGLSHADRPSANDYESEKSAGSQAFACEL